MEKRKVIEIIKEEDVDEYPLQKVVGYDHLNLQELNFEPSPWNMFFGKVIHGTTLIKRPHNIKVNDIVLLDGTMNVKKVIKK